MGQNAAIYHFVHFNFEIQTIRYISILSLTCILSKSSPHIREPWKYLTLGFLFFRNPSNSNSGSSGWRKTASTSSSFLSWWWKSLRKLATVSKVMCPDIWNFHESKLWCFQPLKMLLFTKNCWVEFFFKSCNLQQWRFCLFHSCMNHQTSSCCPLINKQTLAPYNLGCADYMRKLLVSTR